MSGTAALFELRSHVGSLFYANRMGKLLARVTGLRGAYDGSDGSGLHRSLVSMLSVGSRQLAINEPLAAVRKADLKAPSHAKPTPRNRTMLQLEVCEYWVTVHTY